jgi:transposase
MTQTERNRDSVCRSRHARRPHDLDVRRPAPPYEESLRLLRIIDRLVPKDKQAHLIVDNYATHKHTLATRWLERRPCVHVHVTPTSCSWLNMVERFFPDLTETQLRRAVFRKVEELLEPIGEYIENHNRQPKPFIWTTKAWDILEKVKRVRSALA